MSSPSQIEAGTRRGAPVGIAIAILASASTAICAISAQSLWIDELNSAWKAGQVGFANFLDVFLRDRSSDIQMPGYMMGLWAWAHALSATERALRGFNLLWFLAAQAALCFVLRAHPRVRIWAALCAAASPFLWAYLDEARPYIMQYCGAMMLAVACANIGFAPSPRKLVADLAVFVAGGIILCSASLFGVIYSGLFGAAFVSLLVRQRPLRDSCRNRGIWLLGAALLLAVMPLGAFYVWTLAQGARASGVGATSPLNLGFVLYEMLGFAGLGPGRIDLRENGLAAMRPFLPTLAIGGLIVMGPLAWMSLTRSWTKRVLVSPLAILAAVFLSAMLVSFLVGMAGGFRVLGRHLMPVFPLLLLAIGWLLSEMFASGGFIAKILSVLVPCLWLASAVSFRASPRFAKDDYRSAAAVATAALLDNGTVWWAAEPLGAGYYRVGIQGPKAQLARLDPGAPARVHFVCGFDDQALARLPFPRLVVLSKTDVYDPSGAIRRWLSDNRFEKRQTLPAFTLWHRTRAATSEP